MRALILDQKAMVEIARVKANAEAKPYHHDNCGLAPGDDHRFVAQLGAYRAVFTITHAKDIVFRHLTVSVPGRKYPHPAAVFMIADALGFTGWNERDPATPAAGWTCGPHGVDRCVVVAQELLQ